MTENDPTRSVLNAACRDFNAAATMLGEER